MARPKPQVACVHHSTPYLARVRRGRYASRYVPAALPDKEKAAMTKQPLKRV
jgi:hypothetical protein